MYLLQKAKASIPFLCKARTVRLFLVFAVLLTCLTVVSQFAGAKTAYAASGGGCRSNGYIEACVSENSEYYVVPDGYVLHTSMCDIKIYLYDNGNEDTHIDYGNRCFSAGTHLNGLLDGAYYGHSWQTEIMACTYNPGCGNQWQLVWSPVLYT